LFTHDVVSLLWSFIRDTFIVWLVGGLEFNTHTTVLSICSIP